MDITGLGHLTGCTAAWHFCVLAPSRQIVLKIVCLFESVLDNNNKEDDQNCPNMEDDLKTLK